MKRTIAVFALVSFAAGAMFQAWQTDEAWLSRAEAQRIRLPRNNVGFRSESAGSVPRRSPATGTETLTPDERVNISVYEKASPSVVNINTRSFRRGNFFMMDLEVPSKGMGSGFVLDKRGHIVTNYHVIEGARDIQVTLDGDMYDAEIVGEAPTHDVAVIRIEAPSSALHPVTLGDSTRLRVGQRVFAIGNPFGLERTLSTGVVSSLNRTIPSRDRSVNFKRTIRSIIQIDAAINPGNSGGPLLDTKGRLIGMNTAIASPTGQSAGVGFAVPVTTIARVVPELIQNGSVIPRVHGIARVGQAENGLLVVDVEPGGPAEKAGLSGVQVVRKRQRRGPYVYEYDTLDVSQADLIVAVDGEEIHTADGLLNRIESKDPGEEVLLTVRRNDRERTVRLLLESGRE